jgi:Armadillo/beta-catenin-like repeat
VLEPGALDTLRQLLSSKSESIRLQAARALLVAPPDPDVSVPAGRIQDGPNAGGGYVTINMWTLPDGSTTLIPPDGWNEDTNTIDAEATALPSDDDEPPV